MESCFREYRACETSGKLGRTGCVVPLIELGNHHEVIQVIVEVASTIERSYILFPFCKHGFLPCGVTGKWFVGCWGVPLCRGHQGCGLGSRRHIGFYLRQRCGVGRLPNCRVSFRDHVSHPLWGRDSYRSGLGVNSYAGAGGRAARGAPGVILNIRFHPKGSLLGTDCEGTVGGLYR